MHLLEKDIEAYLVKSIQQRGGLCWKFVSPSQRGVPDRWCTCLGFQFFVELKAPHHKRRKDEALQKEVHKKMAQQGVRVYVLETKKDIDLLMRHLDAGIFPKENHFGRL